MLWLSVYDSSSLCGLVEVEIEMSVEESGKTSDYG